MTRGARLAGGAIAAMRALRLAVAIAAGIIDFCVREKWLCVSSGKR